MSLQKIMKTKYTTTESKELVTLRTRKMKDGGQSLLLDYMIDGVRTREFLKMYIVPERNPIDKIQNQETLKLANAMKAKRLLELQEGRTGIRSKGRKDMLLIDFLKEQQEHYRLQEKPNYVLTLSKIIRWLNNYGKKTTLLTVDKEYVLNFCRYMKDSGLSDGTVFMYFANLNTVFNNAYRAGKMPENPINRIDWSERPKRPESTREYLTLDEIKILKKTRCGNAAVKSAFLFACFTGLRLSDIEALQWEQIRKSGKGWQVEKKQIKTRKNVYVPLSQNAMDQLPTPRKKKGKVFALPSRFQVGDGLKNWIKRSGITKTITFHCSRHTYATLLLTYGADLYTVSQLLGHKSIETTQIYAKIIDETKRKTVDLIPELK